MDDDDKERADRRLNLTLGMLALMAEKDDAADLAAIAGGERLSVVARRRAEADGEVYESVRHRLRGKSRKIGMDSICPDPPADIEAIMTEKPLTAAQLRDAFRRKMNAIGIREQILLPRQIELEKAGHAPRERAEPLSHVVMARKLMNGSSHLLPSPADDGDFELADVICERKAIRLVMETVEREEFRYGALILAEWSDNGGEDRWLASRRRVANAILELRAAVDEARVIRQEAVSMAGGMQVSLEGDRGDRPLLTGDAQALLEAIRDAGIVRNISG